MARSVKITTPVPTLDEFGRQLGLSKARRRSLALILIERRPQGGYAVTRRGTEKAVKVFPTQREAVERAREVSPNGTILVQRVRTNGTSDKWRRA